MKFRIVPSNPGQNVVASRQTGKIDVINRGPGLWIGQVQWHLNHDDHSGRKEYLTWVSRLRGQTHQTQIVLPKEYEPVNIPPQGWSAVIGSVRRSVASGVEVLLTQSNGVWNPSVGDMINISSRLYVIESLARGGYLSVLPHAPPSVGDVVEARFPFVVCTATNPEQLALARDGYQYPRPTMDWIEHIV